MRDFNFTRFSIRIFVLCNLINLFIVLCTHDYDVIVPVFFITCIPVLSIFLFEMLIKLLFENLYVGDKK